MQREGGGGRDDEGDDDCLQYRRARSACIIPRVFRVLGRVGSLDCKIARTGKGHIRSLKCLNM